jgi:hypothetical protein
MFHFYGVEGYVEESKGTIGQGFLIPASTGTSVPLVSFALLFHSGPLSSQTSPKERIQF